MKITNNKYGPLTIFSGTSLTIPKALGAIDFLVRQFLIVTIIDLTEYTKRCKYIKDGVSP